MLQSGRKVEMVGEKFRMSAKLIIFIFIFIFILLRMCFIKVVSIDVWGWMFVMSFTTADEYRRRENSNVNLEQLHSDDHKYLWFYYKDQWLAKMELC